LSSNRIVIFGGTFDPPHLGHTAVISGLRRALGLPVLVIPNGRPPHRPEPGADAPCRLHLVRLAVAELDDPMVMVSDLEVRRPGPSFTVDTLAELKAEDQERGILLALGSDAALSLPQWERADLVVSLAQLVVFDRLGAEQRANRVIEELRRSGLPVEGAEAVEIEAPEIEASEIRPLLEIGDSCPGQLSPAVLAEIRSAGLYGAHVGGSRSPHGIIASA
jgi:nicotinate-nucleotide adenylyltransferase